MAGNSGGSADAVVVKHNHNFIYTPEGESPQTVEAITYAPNESGWNNIGCNLGSMANSIKIAYTGESGIGKNMPPYLAVYVWRKIS